MARPKKNTNTQALADKMRKAVLQAAIEGKLTDQHEDDGNARDLLADIETEKQRLIKAGEIKRQKSLPPITEEEKPFDIPDNWEWVRLGELITSTESGKSPKCEKTPVKDDEWGVLTTTSVQKNYFLQRENKILPKKFDLNISMKVKEGDLLITRAGPSNRTGVACVVKNIIYNLILSDKIVRLNYLSDLTNPSYLMFFLNSSLGSSQTLQFASGMDKQQVNLSQDRIKSFLIPIPPLAEQQRIVAKLQEVMPQLDSLQADEDALHALQTAFPNQMQAALLQAAIEGKLTQQDATKDGYASDLLTDIEIEKQKLIKAGEIKRSKTLPPISEEEKPFDIPDNWAWVRLGEVVIVNPRNKAEDNLEAAFVPMKLVEAGYKNIFDFEVRKWMSIKTGYTHFAENDVVFAKITPCFQNLKSAVISNIPNGIGAGTTEFHVLRNFNDHIDIEYLLYFVKNPTFINDGVATFTGTAGQQRIGTDFVKEYLFPLPPLAEQRRIVDLLDQALPEIQTLKEI